VARRRPSRLRGLLVVALLALGMSNTPSPWAALWIAVPVAVAVSLLLAWRFGARALIVPAVLAGLAPLLDGAGSLWVWWIPAAALTGVWMGMREEHALPSGERAWMLLPALLIAAGLPWIPRYGEFVTAVDRALQIGDAQLVDLFRQVGYDGDRLETVRRAIAENARLRLEALPYVLPTALFVWVVGLVAAGRAVSSRVASALRWPDLTQGRLHDWRLPDAALWTFLAGLGLLVSPWTRTAPTAWTLLINSGLGYCVQGIAVVESLLLARGVPPSIIVLTMLFVFTIAMPLFVLTTAVVGLSDVWLDYRRLEPAPDQTQI
jgi:hypothetical protein